jgi:hypothetical protein
MSRSIHTTLRSASNLRRQDFNDPKVKAQLLKEARQELRRKRCIKLSVLDERERDRRHEGNAENEPPMALGVPESIPVEVLDAGPYVHHPLDRDDLVSLLRALPTAAAQGISRIQLSLGKQYNDEHGEYSEGEQRDPWVQRLGCEIFPGVYGGDILGVYSPGSGLIRLHAFVYDPAAVEKWPLPEPAFRGYLRLHVMKTFIHEVAHHHDEVVRVQRGRWLADREENMENYAERMEYEWTQRIGLEWLEHRYADEMRALIDWVETFGGARLPLDFFAGDPRHTRRDGLQSLSCSTSGAFQSFVSEVVKERFSKPSPAVWLTFAWEVHYSDEYDLCLRIVDRVLAQQPDLLDAQVCRADTLAHLERYDEATDLAGQVLLKQPGLNHAWEIRANVLEARAAWLELIALCEDWEKAGEADDRVPRQRAMYRAIAYCGLERWGEMEHWVEVRASKAPTPRVKEALRRLVFRRAGKMSMYKPRV